MIPRFFLFCFVTRYTETYEAKQISSLNNAAISKTKRKRVITW